MGIELLVEAVHVIRGVVLIDAHILSGTVGNQSCAYAEVGYAIHYSHDGIELGYATGWMIAPVPAREDVDR